MSKKVQNIYDDPLFFEGYKNLRKNNSGFNEKIEQPAICSLLPSLNGKVLLDIGCGFGDFARYAIQHGAASVLAIDPSIRMIQEAKSLTHYSKITYQQSTIENFESESTAFDLVVSSLAFHYVDNFNEVISKIAVWLKPGGHLIFSIEHPICTAYPEAEIKLDEHGKKYHPVYNYRDEGAFYQMWFVERVKKFHRKISTYVNILIENGFKIEKILEPQPEDEVISQNPAFAVHKIRPSLLLIRAVLL